MAFIAKQRYKLDIAPKGGWVIVYASQHDDGAREIEFAITNQGNAFSIPASINVSVQGIKANHSYFSHSCSYSGNVVTMALADDMTDIIGKAICVLKFTNSSNQKLATAKFILNVDSDASSEGVIIDTEAEEIFNQMLNDIRAQAASISADIAELQSMVGSPLVASTVSAMTDHSKIYVYTGSESGYTNGNWYYWNGSVWTSGGVYNSVAFETDKTLSVENMAADAFETGNKITSLKEDLKYTDLSEISQGIANNKIVIDGNWERGVLLAADGSEYKNERYIRTGWLKRQEGIDIIYLSLLSIFPDSEGKGQAIRLFQYDANKVFISMNLRVNTVGVTKVTLNDATKYLRLSIGVESYPMATIPFEIKECFEAYAVYTAVQTLEGKMSYLPLLNTSIGYGDYVQGTRFPDGHMDNANTRIASVFVPVKADSIIEIYSPNLYHSLRIYATNADDGTNSEIYELGWQSPSADKVIIDVSSVAPSVDNAYFAINLSKNGSERVGTITPEDATGCYVKVYDKPVELALTAEQKNTIMRSLITLHYSHTGSGTYLPMINRNAITRHIYVPFPVTITAEAGYRFAYQTYDAPEYGPEHLIKASPWYTNESYTIPAYTYFCAIFSSTDNQDTTEETNNHFTFTWVNDFVSEHYDALKDRDGGLHLSLGDAIRYQKEADLTGAKYYNGEKIHLSKHYYKQTTLGITIPAKEGKVRQASALFNNTLFQFYNSDYCIVIDYTTGEQLGAFAVTCGHANSAGFTDVYAEQSDAFPLVFVADWTADTNTVWLYRISTDSATLYATWIFPASECGHYTGFAYNNGKLYGTGYHGTTSSEWYLDATNTIISTYIVNKADMTANPVLKDSFLIDYFPIRQDSASDGAYNIFSSGWGGDYPSQIVFVDMFSKRITNVLSGLSGNLAGEHEGMTVYNGKLVVTDVNGKITELTFDF